MPQTYDHVQRSPFNWLLHVPAVIVFFIAWQSQPVEGAALLIISGLLAAFALSFQTLRVMDGEDHLNVQFGPLNLFGTRVPYHEITSVEPGTTSMIDGWGIHFIPIRGWTLNVWGFECVVIRRGEKIMRIGTDDSENLVRFLKDKLAIAA